VVFAHPPHEDRWERAKRKSGEERDGEEEEESRTITKL